MNVPFFADLVDGGADVLDRENLGWISDVNFLFGVGDLESRKRNATDRIIQSFNNPGIAFTIP